jgi:acyl carrier protein
MEKNREKLVKLLSIILKIPIDSINEKTSPDNTESWDSFNGLMIAAELEKTFNVSFDMEEIITTKNVGDIVNNLRRHSIII